jgi:hypothetical protein
MPSYRGERIPQPIDVASWHTSWTRYPTMTVCELTPKRESLVFENSTRLNGSGEGGE